MVSFGEFVVVFRGVMVLLYDGVVVWLVGVVVLCYDCFVLVRDVDGYWCAALGG